MQEKDLDKTRLRVEKKINSKPLMLLKLSFTYFFVFVSIFLLSAFLFFASGVTGKKVFIFIVINTVLFFIIQRLDSTNILDTLTFTELPKSLNNDLYKLKNGEHSIIKNITNIKGKE